MVLSFIVLYINDSLIHGEILILLYLVVLDLCLNVYNLPFSFLEILANSSSSIWNRYMSSEFTLSKMIEERLPDHCFWVKSLNFVFTNRIWLVEFQMVCICFCFLDLFHFTCICVSGSICRVLCLERPEEGWICYFWKSPRCAQQNGS